MKEIYLQNLAAFDWTASDQVLVADIIEKAILAACPTDGHLDPRGFDSIPSHRAGGQLAVW